jgi:hypothetical protein
MVIKIKSYIKHELDEYNKMFNEKRSRYSGNIYLLDRE